MNTIQRAQSINQVTDDATKLTNGFLYQKNHAIIFGVFNRHFSI
jgi:hypothetical protein